MDIQSTQVRQNKVNEQLSDEDQIREVLDRIAKGIEEADVDAIMSAYAPEAEIFDLRDALAESRDEFRFAWRECFEMSECFKTEAHDLKIRVDNNQAFSHCLSNAIGKAKDGHNIDIWMRVTNCYRKLDGKWFVVHEHVSMPGDFKTGKILQNLKPIFFIIGNLS